MDSSLSGIEDLYDMVSEELEVIKTNEYKKCTSNGKTETGIRDLTGGPETGDSEVSDGTDPVMDERDNDERLAKTGEVLGVKKQDESCQNMFEKDQNCELMMNEKLTMGDNGFPIQYVENLFGDKLNDKCDFDLNSAEREILDGEILDEEHTSDILTGEYLKNDFESDVISEDDETNIIPSNDIPIPWENLNQNVNLEPTNEQSLVDELPTSGTSDDLGSNDEIISFEPQIYDEENVEGKTRNFLELTESLTNYEAEKVSYLTKCEKSLEMTDINQNIKSEETINSERPEHEALTEIKEEPLNSKGQNYINSFEYSAEVDSGKYTNITHSNTLEHVYIDSENSSNNGYKQLIVEDPKLKEHFIPEDVEEHSPGNRSNSEDIGTKKDDISDYENLASDHKEQNNQTEIELEFQIMTINEPDDDTTEGTAILPKINNSYNYEHNDRHQTYIEINNNHSCISNPNEKEKEATKPACVEINVANKQNVINNSTLVTEDNKVATVIKDCNFRNPCSAEKIDAKIFDVPNPQETSNEENHKQEVLEDSVVSSTTDCPSDKNIIKIYEASAPPIKDDNSVSSSQENIPNPGNTTGGHSEEEHWFSKTKLSPVKTLSEEHHISTSKEFLKDENIQKETESSSTKMEEEFIDELDYTLKANNESISSIGEFEDDFGINDGMLLAEGTSSGKVQENISSRSKTSIKTLHGSNDVAEEECITDYVTRNSELSNPESSTTFNSLENRTTLSSKKGSYERDTVMEQTVLDVYPKIQVVESRLKDNFESSLEKIEETYHFGNTIVKWDDNKHDELSDEPTDCYIAGEPGKDGVSLDEIAFDLLGETDDKDNDTPKAINLERRNENSFGLTEPEDTGPPEMSSHHKTLELEDSRKKKGKLQGHGIFGMYDLKVRHKECEKDILEPHHSLPKNLPSDVQKPVKKHKRRFCSIS